MLSKIKTRHRLITHVAGTPLSISRNQFRHWHGKCSLVVYQNVARELYLKKIFRLELKVTIVETFK